MLDITTDKIIDRKHDRYARCLLGGCTHGLAPTVLLSELLLEDGPDAIFAKNYAPDILPDPDELSSNHSLVSRGYFI